MKKSTEKSKVNNRIKQNIPTKESAANTIIRQLKNTESNQRAESTE